MLMHLKKLSQITPKIIAKAKESGIDISKDTLSLKDPENVYKLHSILDQLGIIDKHKVNLFTSVLAAKPNMKPNLIFDVTLKSIDKFYTIAQQAANLGYDAENIHLVWVINDFEIATIQNKERERVVPNEIFKQTHVGTSMTMQELITNAEKYRKYMDGDIVFAFNKVSVDSTLEKSERGGSYIKDANYIYVKRKGKSALSIKEIGKDIIDKIIEYTPKPKTWKDELDNF